MDQRLVDRVEFDKLSCGEPIPADDSCNSTHTDSKGFLASTINEV
jgi:hypothetical protein